MVGPRICVAVPATTTADVLETIHRLKEPDLVELRLDYAAEALNLKVLRKSTDVHSDRDGAPSQPRREMGQE